MSKPITLDTPIKFLRENGSATHAGKKSYPINRWMRVKGPLVLCKNGYHYTTPRHWRTWLTTRIHLIEAEEAVFGNDKYVARGIELQPRLTTWTPRSLVLFAADCAERVLPRFERHFPDDLRPRQAIEAARSGSAAHAADAAYAAAHAAHAAADAAAYAAAYAAYAADAAAHAVYAAAHAAHAADAAHAVYAAAHAVYAAAHVARGAARGAAHAARGAEVAWQDARFLQYLNGEVG